MLTLQSSRFVTENKLLMQNQNMDLYIFFLCFLGIKKKSQNTLITPCLNPSNSQRISYFDEKMDTSFSHFIDLSFTITFYVIICY